MKNSDVEQTSPVYKKIYSPKFLLLMTALVFASSLFFPFIALDDAKHIWQNPYVMTLSWSNLIYFWTAPYYGLYAPLIYNTWSVLAWVTQSLGWTHETSGISATLFHAFCLLMHLLNVYLVWLLFSYCVQNDPQKRPWVFFATAIFSFHPLQVEAVAWVSGLKDILSAQFILLAIHCFFQMFSWNHKKQTKTQSPSRFVHFFSHHAKFKFLFFSICALLTKPIAVVLPFFLLLINTLFNRQKIRSVILALLPVLVIALYIMWITKNAQPSARLEFTLETWQKPFVALATIGFYIVKFFAPYPLTPDYGLTPPLLLESKFIFVYYLAALSTVIGFALSLRASFHGAKWVALGIGLFVLGFAPVLGLVHFEFQNLSTVADRYFYLFPALGMGFLLLGFCEWLTQKKINTIGTLAIQLCIIGWVALTSLQTLLWANNERLFLHVIMVNPQSYLALNNLGLQHLRQKDYGSAAQYFSQALKVKPDYLAAIANLGVVYFKQQNFMTTIQHYEQALSRLPKAGAGSPATYADMYFNLGAAYINTQNVPRGIESLKLAVQINPDHFMAHYHLGRAYLVTGQISLAKEALQQALRLQPGDPRVLEELKKI